MPTRKYDAVIPGQTPDIDFFSALDEEHFPGLKGIAEKAQAEDTDAAVAQFGAFLRAFLDSHLYDDDDYVPGGVNFQPGETREHAAERIRGHLLISCGISHQYDPEEVEWELNPTPDHYAEYTWQEQRHHEFQVLAWMYRHTRDEKYALSYRELMTSWLAQSAPCPLDLGGGETNFWRTIECGIRMGHTWPSGIFSFISSPSLSDRDWVNIFKCIYEHGLRLRKSYTVSNWLIMEMNGLATQALLYPFFRLSGAWEEFATKKMAEQIEEQVYPDGFQQELTTNYHQVVIINYEATLRAYVRTGKQMPSELCSAMEKMYGVYPYIAMPDLVTPNLNDGADLPMRDCLAMAVQLYPEREDFLFLQSERKAGNPPEFTSCMMPYTGYAIMRSDWSDHAFWCFFEDAPVGFGHRHEDKLEVLLHAYGKYMMPEAGRHAYDGSPLFTYSLGSYGHNTVIVDDETQGRRETIGWDPAWLHEKAGLLFQTNDDFDSAEGVYSDKYGPQAIDVVHHRRVLWLKKPTGARPLVVVIDRMEPKDGKDHNYTAIWHFADGKYSNTDHTAQIDFPEGQGITLATTADRTELVRARENPVQGFLCDEVPGQFKPLPTALCSVSGGALRFVTVLEATPDGKASLTGVSASRSSDDTKITITTDSGSIALDETDYFTFAE